MAFLCPVRIKRSKKKKPLNDDSLSGPAPSMGRITGSASIETLVRVGIEKENGLSPESKMVVLHDFTPCVDDELQVKRGQIVHVLYQENDWVYVISEANSEGFIPHSYCAQFGSQMAQLALNVKKKMPRGGGGGGGGGENNDFAGGGGGGGGGPGGGSGRAPSMNGLPTTAMSAAQLQQPPATSAITSGKLLPPSASSGSSASQNNLTTSAGPASSSASAAGGRLPGVDQSDSESSLRPMIPPPGGSSGAAQGGFVRGGGGGGATDQSRSNSLMSDATSSSGQQGDVHPFYKEPSGRYIVLYSYAAQDENDLSVERGQCVTVLNSEDPDWYWVVRYDQCEGFVPAGFIYPLDAIQRQQTISAPKPVPNTKPHMPTGGKFLQQQQQPSFLPGQQQKQQQHRQQQQPPLHSQYPPPSTPSKGSLSSPQHHQPPLSSSSSNNGLPQHHAQHFDPLGSTGGSSGPPSYGTGIGIAGQQQQQRPRPMQVDSQSTNGLPVVPQQQSQLHQPGLPNVASLGDQPAAGNGVDQNRYNGTELVMLYDYKAQAPDDLTVRRGDWVYADLSNQTVDGWLWSYAPKTRKYGFIPKAYARPPAMTSL